MTITDFSAVFYWWLVFFVLGIIFLPFCSMLFNKFFDKGYIFSKVIGIIAVSYLILVLGEVHILPFTYLSLIAVIGLFGILNFSLLYYKKQSLFDIKSLRIFAGEELIFLAGLLFWSTVRAHQPDIQGLEKYMDFGFVNSILRSTYFPPADMWYPPFPINYYYFGHLTTAVVTILSNIPSHVSYNLMISTLFAFCFSCGFSVSANFMHIFLQKDSDKKDKNQTRKNNALTTFLSFKTKFIIFISGILGAFLLSLGGNLHTVYAFFKPYDVENVVPFWKLTFLPQNFPNAYWYPNATRFIYHTIHEFPIYSFVVSDLHGHVLDIPFVFLTISSLFILFLKRGKPIHPIWTIGIGFLLAIMYMTNAWDGAIYMLLAGLVYFTNVLPDAKNLSFFDRLFNTKHILKTIYYLLITFVSFFVFSLPFSVFFKPFASQIGVMCAPAFLTNIGHLGPLLFEVNHCEHSPLYQLLILHGFWFFWFFGFVIFLFIKRKEQELKQADFFVILLGILSTILIIIPEFVYLKDIYPTYYRANTMFKLVYQSFMMFAVSCGYIVVRFAILKKKSILLWIYSLIGIFLFFFVGIYPFFAIGSYYNNLNTYYGLEGLNYIKNTYPNDYLAISWINSHIKGQPVILEAQGDSYTDYARVSANTGLPTVLGWTVHEWLWRGSYDPLPERINDIQRLYETQDLGVAKGLIKKYNISLIFIGDLEKKKYTNLNEGKFKKLGKIIYQNKTTTIYQVAF